MAAFLRRQGGQFLEISLADALWIAHYFLGQGLGLSMEEGVNVTIVIVVVVYTMKAHEVFDEGVAHRESRLHGFQPILIICHF